uniref:Chitin-binding type-2 domain-containing protein n=1 Tax=Anopheles funestus TaxID=62324 RepID=A0A182RWK8_ANOFN
MMINRVLIVLTSVVFACTTGELLCSEELFNGLGGTLPNPRSPSEYSRCVEGAVQTVPCPNGQYFDTHTRKCLFERVAQETRMEQPFQFEELCNNPNVVEVFPNPTNCSQYIICYGLVPIEQSCTNGLLFNPQLNTCDIPGNVICGYSCPAEDDPYNPVWLPDSRLEDCSRHYLCFQGNPLQFYCYNNLYFDIVSRTCTYPQYSACSVPDVYCSINVTINVANPRSCTSYYVCVDGFPHFRNCDFGEYFSEDLGVCIPGTCQPGTTTTVGSTTNEPTSTTVSSGTTPSFTSTTDLNTPTTGFTSTIEPITTSPSFTTPLESTTVSETTMSPTTSVESSTTVDFTTFPTVTDSTTFGPTTPELTTSGEITTTGTPTMPSTTLETTSELSTDSTTIEISTQTSTQDFSTTTTVSSTSELTESTPETTSELTTESTTIEISTQSSTQDFSTTTTVSSTSELTESTPETTTPETTSELSTESSTIEISTQSSTEDITTTTTVSSTSELTETTTVELTTTTTEMVTIDPNEVCAGQGVIILPYPGNCYMYIVCISGIGGVSTCAVGEIFNPVSATCVPGNQETCTLS